MDTNHEKRRRLFVALPISQVVQEKILTWQEGFLKLPVRWLRGKNLHVTLIPPWYESDINAAKAKLRLLRYRGAPIALEFNRVTFGLDSARPRLIWASGKTPRALLDLQGELEKIFRPQEHRPFFLHLTFARFREEDCASFSMQKLDESVSWQEQVNTVALMASHLSRAGADYEIIESISIA